ncbi:MAG TPA: alpha/beta fold hydrolase [Bryobacteraceae bacterium]|nr:alpha/beta fold hydrolase [Bryobacteraceae bacterium]
MRRLLAAILLAAGLGAAEPPAAVAKKALDALLAGRYEEFSRMLTPEAKALLTPEFLSKRVDGELKGFGAFEKADPPMTAHAGTSDLVSFPAHFSNTTVDVQFTINEAGLVAGLHFRPPDQPLPPTWSRPAYSNPALFHEKAVTVGGDQWKLPGTLTVPEGKGPFPAIVLVHGPGPNDRDESMFANRIFADIAEGLGSRGIAVLRYDKRTKVYGAQMSELEFTLNDETVEDAVRAVALLRQQPEVDAKRVFVLGHSLGGYAAPRIAARSHVNGAIVLAGNARRIEDIAIAQTEFMLKARGNISADDQRRLDAMKEQAQMVRDLDASKPHPPVLLGLPAAYFVDLRDYDPAGEAKRLGIPLLFLQGERDFQVTMEDFGMWKAGLADSKQAAFRTYPALNHLFIAGEGAGSPAEYRTPGNVAPAVIEDIANWLKQ